MMIKTKFDFGETVYIKTDPDQRQRTVSEVKVLPGPCIIYMISCGVCTSTHYDFELDTDKDHIIATTN